MTLAGRSLARMNADIQSLFATCGNALSGIIELSLPHCGWKILETYCKIALDSIKKVVQGIDNDVLANENAFVAIKRHFTSLPRIHLVARKSTAKIILIDKLKLKFFPDSLNVLCWIFDYWALLYGSVSLSSPLESDFVFEEVRSFCYDMIFQGVKEVIKTFWSTCFFLAGMRTLELLFLDDFVFDDAVVLTFV